MLPVTFCRAPLCLLYPMPPDSQGTKFKVAPSLTASAWTRACRMIARSRLLAPARRKVVGRSIVWLAAAVAPGLAADAGACVWALAGSSRDNDMVRTANVAISWAVMLVTFSAIAYRYFQNQGSTARWHTCLAAGRHRDCPFRFPPA